MLELILGGVVVLETAYIIVGKVKAKADADAVFAKVEADAKALVNKADADVAASLAKLK